METTFGQLAIRDRFQFVVGTKFLSTETTYIKTSQHTFRRPDESCSQPYLIDPDTLVRKIEDSEK